MDNQLINKIKKLRKESKTYREIKDIVGKDIPKSTLSYWCKDISMSESYKEKARKINIENLKKAREKAVQVNQKKQEKLFKELAKNNQHLIRYLDKNVCKMLLSILYIGEGSKYINTRYLKLGSSSPLIINMYLKLLFKSFNINNNKFRVTVQCRADQNVKELEKFWKSIINIENIRFYKTQIDKRTIGKKTIKKDYKGVCVISYFDTKIQLELELLASQIEKWL